MAAALGFALETGNGLRPVLTRHAELVSASRVDSLTGGGLDPENKFRVTGRWSENGLGVYYNLGALGISLSAESH
jgi:hypothetical protein